MTFVTIKEKTFLIKPTNRSSGNYAIQITLTDKNNYPKTSKYSLQIKVPSIKSEVPGGQENKVVTNKTSKVISAKTINCTLNLMHATRDGKVYLKILGTTIQVQSLLALKLNNMTLSMKILPNQNVPF